VEILVVVAVIVVMTTLSIPAFNAIRGGTDFTSEVYDVAGMLNQARSYAIANDTYVLAGIIEVSGAQDSSASTQVIGTGRIAMAIIASKSGTRPYQSLINAGTLGNWVSQSLYITGTAFVPVTQLMTFTNLHMVDLQPPPSSGAGTMARPSVSQYYDLPNASCTSSTWFGWPLGKSQYTFSKVIEFDPQGCARIISASNPASYPDGVPQFIEIGLQPAHGTIAAGPPSSQSTGAGQIAAIQITGVSGANQTYRP
jgi:type II secretory pathway pseudopilin PulG